ncbi:helix-turn-helix domain-containing protein [Sanguibacter suaedae]|uniref:helix-turn-helix domain-containing protein n=1 Tax=Sanguibacter suaedae TaxID=2795737 RepID=UPI001E356806|nr:helix-turn-helix domain-containing protein [Sanguibacter suaedae]
MEGIDVGEWVRPSVPAPHDRGATGVDDLQSAIGSLRAARARQSVARLDFLRGLRAVTHSGLATQSAIARELGISQSAVSQNLQEEAKLAPVREGFHGSDPQEIIMRFAAGDLSREQVVDELSRWPYLPSDGLEGPMDDLLVTVRGSFDDVEDAVVSGALPRHVYDEVLTRVTRPHCETARTC